MQAGERPGELSAGEVASMSSGKASKGSCSRGSQPPSGQGLGQAQSSAELVVGEMGKEWLVDVSQVRGSPRAQLAAPVPGRSGSGQRWLHRPRAALSLQLPDAAACCGTQAGRTCGFHVPLHPNTAGAAA